MVCPQFPHVFLVLSISVLGASCLQSRVSAEQSSDSYREGLQHIEQGRPVEAIRAFRTAADGGDAAAIDVLGSMYLQGKGVLQSDWIAYGHFMDAASRGNATACWNLGKMYFDGAGVEQDYAPAVRWWSEAAKGGDHRAADRLAHLFHSGDGVAVDRKRAIKLWADASGSVPATDKRPAIALAFARVMSEEPEVAEEGRTCLEELARGGNRRAVDAVKYLAARANPGVLLLDIPHIQQAHNYCAPASAAMILRYQGIEVSQFDVHRRCPNTKVGDGVFWSDLLVAVGQCGGNWGIKTHAATDEGFAEAKAFVVEELSAGRPLIIDWFDTTNAHTVVLCGYDANAEEFFFRNTGLTYPGIHVRSESWLKTNWATRNYVPHNSVVRRAAIRILPDDTTTKDQPDIPPT